MINEILGLPEVNSKLLPPHVLVAVKEQLSKIPECGAVIIYGSMIRGDASVKSDIDILLVPVSQKDRNLLRKRSSKILSDIESEFKLKNTFSINIYKGSEDSYFLWEAAKDGAVLYSKPEMILNDPEAIKPYALISYTFMGLSDKIKKRIQRFLFESKTGIEIDKQNRMEYIAPGVILISIDRSKKTIELFDESGIEYSLVKVWL